MSEKEHVSIVDMILYPDTGIRPSGPGSSVPAEAGAPSAEFSGPATPDAGPRTIRGRFAPTPSGFMHLGNARTALVAWMSARSKGGKFIWRLEDLDGPRSIKGAAEQAKRDMAWLGIDWDEGGEMGGKFGPYKQSQRSGIYDMALGHLEKTGRLFPCTYSRKELQDIALAPHTAEVSPYPTELRPQNLDPNWFKDFCEGDRKEEIAVRFKVDPVPIMFNDLVYGRQESDVMKECGDFVLKRKDGIFAYQLAVVVDDISMNVSEVVRGVDLLSSTARQIQLINALGGRVPEYTHLPLLRDSNKEKLSKRNEDLELRYLKAEGVAAEKVLGYLMHSLELLDEFKSISIEEALSIFDLNSIGKVDTVMDENIVDILK